MAKLSTVQKSASTEIKTSPTNAGSTALCCGGHNCFGPKKRWSDSASGQMSEVYCRACDTQSKLVEAIDSDASGDSAATITGAAESSAEDNIDSPACLANITPKRRAGSKTKPAANVLTIESELEIPSGKGLLKIDKKSSSSSTPKLSQQKKASTVKTKKATTVTKAKISKAADNLNGRNNNKKIEEYEWADDATAFDAAELPTTEKLHRKVGILNAIDSKLMIRVQGTEELPARQQTTVAKKQQSGSKQHLPSVVDNNKLKTHSIASSSLKSSSSNRSKIISTNNVSSDVQPPAERRSVDCDDHNGNAGSRFNRLNRNYSTLPKMKRIGGGQPLHAGHERPMKKIPMRTTPDGTNIYYWCDMSKRAIKGLVFAFFLYLFCQISVYSQQY